MGGCYDYDGCEYDAGDDMDSLYFDMINDEECGFDENGWPRVTNFNSDDLSHYQESVNQYNTLVGEEVLKVLPYGIQTGIHKPGSSWRVEDQGCLLKKPGYVEDGDTGLSRFWEIFDTFYKG